jgi:hypothetical protein
MCTRSRVRLRRGSSEGLRGRIRIQSPGFALPCSRLTITSDDNGSRFHAPRTPHPASRTPHPASRIPHPEPRIPHPASRTPHPASRTPHPASRIPNPASRIPHPEPRIPQEKRRKQDGRWGGDRPIDGVLTPDGARGAGRADNSSRARPSARHGCRRPRGGRASSPGCGRRS